LQKAVTSFPVVSYERFLESNRFGPNWVKAGSLCVTGLVHFLRKRCSRSCFYVEETRMLEPEKRHEHVFDAKNRCHSHALGVTTR
jgi:hypothetical protein